MWCDRSFCKSSHRETSALTAYYSETELSLSHQPLRRKRSLMVSLFPFWHQLPKIWFNFITLNYMLRGSSRNRQQFSKSSYVASICLNLISASKAPLCQVWSSIPVFQLTFTSLPVKYLQDSSTSTYSSHGAFFDYLCCRLTKVLAG